MKYRLRTTNLLASAALSIWYNRLSTSAKCEWDLNFANRASTISACTQVRYSSFEVPNNTWDI